jgi:sugar phosphate isomerase/epimerase
MAFDMDDLTMSLAGLRDDPFTCNAENLAAMLAACAAEGFRGLSVWAMHVEQVEREGMSHRGLVRLCDEHGLQIRMLEGVSSWAGGDRNAIDAEARQVFTLAAALGAEEVLAFDLGTEPIEVDVASRGFAYVCDLAARHGLRVALEFLPWTCIPDLRTAWGVVSRAGRENGGLVIDSWHWQREPGGPDPDTLRSIPGDRVHVVQLNDAPRTASAPLVEETMNGRLLPGEGDIDLDSLLGALDDIGAEPIVSPEVFNPAIGALGPDEAARRIAASTRAVLSRSGR